MRVNFEWFITAATSFGRSWSQATESVLHSRIRWGTDHFCRHAAIDIIHRIFGSGRTEATTVIISVSEFFFRQKSSPYGIFTGETIVRTRTRLLHVETSRSSGQRQLLDSTDLRRRGSGTTKRDDRPRSNSPRLTVSTMSLTEVDLGRAPGSTSLLAAF